LVCQKEARAHDGTNPARVIFLHKAWRKIRCPMPNRWRRNGLPWHSEQVYLVAVVDRIYAPIYLTNNKAMGSLIRLPWICLTISRRVDRRTVILGFEFRRPHCISLFKLKSKLTRSTHELENTFEQTQISVGHRFWDSQTFQLPKSIYYINSDIRLGITTYPWILSIKLDYMHIILLYSDQTTLRWRLDKSNSRVDEMRKNPNKTRNVL
jgi:hypothetical protein